MKIRRLIVSKYKNVKNLNLKFKASLISLLVGRNGLGKSNLIEILVLIFRDLERNKNQEEFSEWAYANDHFEYFIEYECLNSDLRILYRKGYVRFFRKQKGSLQRHEELSTTEFIKDRLTDFLPKYIIGYYSGENKRIKESIKPYEQAVYNDLYKNEGLDKTLRRLFFGENYHAKIILLTLLLYKDQDGDFNIRNRIAELISNYCSFTELESIDVTLKQPIWYKRGKTRAPQYSIENLDENLLNGIEFPFWNAKGKANKIISYLYNSAEKYNGYYDDSLTEKKEKLELTSLKKVDLSSKVYKEFDHPINFFDALESLFQILAIESIDLVVRSKQEGVSFDVKELSEGEQQLITVLGLILITGKDDCLFLLDEPDTHLNPRWQRDYVKLLEDFNLNDDNSHIIVATHSPLIVQAGEETDIFLYKQVGEKIVVDNNEKFKIHNWRIDQVLASEYFQFENTRPPQIDKFMKKREELLSKHKLSKDDIAEIKNVEDELGLLPSGETLNDFKAMYAIRQTAKEIGDDKN